MDNRDISWPGLWFASQVKTDVRAKSGLSRSPAFLCMAATVCRDERWEPAQERERDLRVNSVELRVFIL